VANDTYPDTCQIPINACSGNTNYCDAAYNKCLYSAGNTCTAVTNSCKPDTNVCNIAVVNACMPPDVGDKCLKGVTPSSLKMCERAQTLCATDGECPAGDTCGNPTSRTVVAKRTLTKVIGDNYNVLNLGLMTFYQAGYYPYYQASSPVPTIETQYITSLQMAGCYSAATGPKAICTYRSDTYSLATGKNSKYAVVQKSKKVVEVDAAWCGAQCVIPNVGTGQYQGSYYTHTVYKGGGSTTLVTSSSYQGQSYASGGFTYQYFEPRPDYYNGAPAPPISGPNCSSNQCSATCGARWDTGLSDFIAPTAGDASRLASAVRLLNRMNKASDGGLLTYGGTPSGCTLENTTTKAKESSAYHYVQTLKSTDPIPCRQNYVLFITDGEANGPGDSECTKDACSAANPEAAGCTCKAVLSAWHLRKGLGVRTFVVGFSADVATGAARIINDNVAKAGGTDQSNDGKTPFAFVATNEADLLVAIQSAIYDAVAGSYSTAPATASSGTQVASGVKSGSFALDSRVDFPSWEGHLLAYDVTVTPPRLAWDANVELKKLDWRGRKVYVGTKDGNIVKVAIDKNTGQILNRDSLNALGLGADPDEAERIMKFTLGAPESGNPAILGAIINSTPIDVGQPGESSLPGGHAFFVANKSRPNLIYVGSSDGLLHAFFGQDTKVNGTTYAAGSEAFAFLPYSMFSSITKIFVQGGQKSDPNQHVFGLANSPKVKSLCVQNCTKADHAVWKTLLVMNEGFGGANIFVLDITNPLGEFGFSEPPVMPVWHSSDSNLALSYAASVGLTTSVPAFYFNKTDTMNDFRLVFGSGYKNNPASTMQGKRIISASATTGQLIDVQTVSTSGSCTQEFGIVADVASAKDFSRGESGKLRAAYTGDTWGNLWRYDGAKLSKVTGWGCNYPLHFAPTVVQLDRDDPANNAGVAFLVQVTNSALDNDTIALPASSIIVRKEIKDAGGSATADTTFGSNGELVLTVGTKDVCAVTGGKGLCTTLLPTHARPLSTPLAILKKDGSGFMS
jgi:ABC-type amino acid transport substrate-binding protein